MESIKTKILQRLIPVGIPASDISFRGSGGKATYFTYQGWRLLPAQAMESIEGLVYERLDETDDGDEDGKPITLRKWYYEYVNN